ncbi:hypothetical protein [Mangrovibacterium lignilyticum]|uniref:hypothetical protein n=1 Tax=Mangrovibacterium lignilyticum TaxID=2668052 RepID=UPI0013D304D3|nr:hypothetical protein [Mangrovibacterium lignilyticum]
MSALKIVGGIIAIVVGLYVGYQTVIHPIHPADDTNKINFQGYISSIMAIVLGILLIMDVVG